MQPEIALDSPSTLGLVFYGVALAGTVLALGGFVALLVAAFRKSVGWGLTLFLGLLAPCVSFLAVVVFSLRTWSEARKPFLVWALGMTLVVGGAAGMATQAGSAAQAFLAAVAEQAGARGSSPPGRDDPAAGPLGARPPAPPGSPGTDEGAPESAPNAAEAGSGGADSGNPDAAAEPQGEETGNSETGTSGTEHPEAGEEEAPRGWNRRARRPGASGEETAAQERPAPAPPAEPTRKSRPFGTRAEPPPPPRPALPPAAEEKPPPPPPRAHGPRRVVGPPAGIVPPRPESRYQIVTVEEARGFIGYGVELITVEDKSQRGILRKIDGEKVLLEADVGGGSVTFPVPLDRVAEIRILK